MSKKRVLIIGNSPIPTENSTKNHAPGIRTWHFACAAKNTNCDVMVIGCRLPKSYEENIQEILSEKIDDIEYYSIEPKVFENSNWMIKKIQEFKPDSIMMPRRYARSQLTAASRTWGSGAIRSSPTSDLVLSTSLAAP